MTPEPYQPTFRVLNALRSIVRAMRMDTRAIELRHGMSLAQIVVLQELVQRDASSLSDLARRTATHQSSVSVIVSRLVDRGFVIRDRSTIDKRRVRIAVTPEGRALAARTQTTVFERLRTALMDSSPRSTSRLAELLTRWTVASGIELVERPSDEGDESISNTQAKCSP